MNPFNYYTHTSFWWTRGYRFWIYGETVYWIEATELHRTEVELPPWKLITRCSMPQNHQKQWVRMRQSQNDDTLTFATFDDTEEEKRFHEQLHIPWIHEYPINFPWNSPLKFPMMSFQNASPKPAATWSISASLSFFFTSQNRPVVQCFSDQAEFKELNGLFHGNPIEMDWLHGKS